MDAMRLKCAQGLTLDRGGEEDPRLSSAYRATAAPERARLRRWNLVVGLLHGALAG
jgi:hypothetical protein